MAAPTGCAAVIVDSEGRNQIAVAGGANLEAKASQIKDGELGLGTTMLVQCEVRPEENRELIRRAAAAGARVLFNAAPAGPLDADMLQSIDCLLVNEIEASHAAKAAGLGASGPIEEARALAGAFEMGCVVTMGSGGAYASLPGGEWPGGEWQVDALPVEPVDTTGAGDAFVGVFAASLDAGLDAAEALHRAAVAGSLACLTEGAQPSLPSAADIDQRLAGLAPGAEALGCVSARGAASSEFVKSIPRPSPGRFIDRDSLLKYATKGSRRRSDHHAWDTHRRGAVPFRPRPNA